MIHTKPSDINKDDTQQPVAGIGHNRGPNIPAPASKGGKMKTELFGLHAAWLRFAEEVELRRLAVLHVRIERKKAAMAAMVSERQKIMNRCIRRMRRKDGKN